MRETSAPIDLVDDRTLVRPNWARWTVPMVLLTLMIGLVAATFFYRSSLNALGTADTILFILTALLCTFMTVYLTLVGCGRWLTRIERSFQPLAANLTAIQETQVRQGDALRKTNQEGSTKAALEEKNQHLLQDLANNLQAVTATVTTLRDTVQGHTEVTHTGITSLAASYGRLTADLQTLRELSEKTAGGATDAMRERVEAAHAAIGGLTGQVQALNESTQKIVGSVTEVLRERAESIHAAIGGLAGGHDKLAGQVQALNELNQKTVGNVTDVVRERAESIQAAIHGLAAGHDKLAGQVQALQESTQKTVGGVTEVVRERVEATQAAMGSLVGGYDKLAGQVQGLTELTQKTVGGVTEVVRERAEATQAALSGLASGYDKLASQVQALNEQGQKAIGGVTDVVRERAEATQAAIGGLASGYDKLAGQVQALNESTQKTVGSVTDVVRERAGATHAAIGGLAAAYDKLAGQIQALNELNQKTAASVTDVVRQRAEATQAAIGGLTSGYDKLAGQVQALQELSQKTAGSVTDAAREQTAAQNTLRDSTRVLVSMTEAIQQSQKALLTEIQKVAEAARQTIAAVTTATLGQTAAHEMTKKTLATVTGLGAAQETIREGLRAHAGTTDTTLAALAAGQGKLTTDIQELHELTRAVADNVTGVAGEQTALCGSLQDNARMWTAAAQVLEESQNTLHAQVEKAVQTAEQIIATVGSMAVEQTTARETTRHMIGELANAAMAALTAGRLPSVRGNQPPQTLAPAAAEIVRFEVMPPEIANVSAPLWLPASQAITHGAQIRYEAGPGRDNLGYWVNAGDWAQWNLNLAQPGRFRISAEIAAVTPARFQVAVGDQTIEANTPNTGDYGHFERVELGTLDLPAAGPLALAVRPIPEGWQPMNLKSVDLVPLI
jgi:phage-related protein